MESAAQPGAPTAAKASIGARYRGAERRRTITVTIATDRLACHAGSLPPLAKQRGLTLLGSSLSNASALISRLERDRPRVLLLDRRMLHELGEPSARTISASFPGMRVLLICDRLRADLVHEIARNRFHGYLLTRDSAATCVRAICKVNRGEIWLPRAVLEYAFFDVASESTYPDLMTEIIEKLTTRERETVRLVLAGLTNKQIAEQLGVREDTIKKHLHSAYAKLGVQRRSQLIAAQSDFRSATS